ncbi:MAG: 16S rRNA (guanine(966)-N(2))-methyltransferase RsmD [Lachnospiraceae bacterium]|nr:16S rRNA (guanine(966)-N(2))-methyltransferase RsmD [Lachnospiraceae bacterium]
MRVIAGSAKSIKLKTIDGLYTRPTTDRIKETLFNIIQNDVSDCRFLDLFSGSGAIGIEALSRGASFATFVDNNKEAVKCIKHNLDFTNLVNKAQVIESSVLSAISLLSNKGNLYDVVFIDPPYNNEYEKEVLIRLKDSDIIDEYSLIIVEASKETDFSYIREIGYKIIKEKIYKTNKHIFVQKV